MTFPKDFVWGAAAASYQIEGAFDTDGRGLSVWDMFSHTPGKVWHDHNGDVACDHYNRYKEDVALMKSINLQAYRLSISWSRFFPEGAGRLNEAGVSFYDRLIDELLGAGIEPYVTLFHWDFPYALYCKGGWLNRDSADWFADYTEQVAKVLGDRVNKWMTFNEPSVFSIMGHRTGEHAPGDKVGLPEFMRVVHHILLAHGKSVQALRANTKDAKIAIVPNMMPAIPLTETPEMVKATHEAFWHFPDEDAFWSPATWLDPIVKGEYHPELMEKWGQYLPIQEGDLAQIKQPLDFLGLNIYNGFYLDADGEGSVKYSDFVVGNPLTMMDWNVTPRALYWGPKLVYDRYKLPIYITENGLASMDWVALDGNVHDANRIDFLNRYLREFKRASADGVETLGYFQWSIMDNFEWAEGYRKRFGLVYVDYQTQKRTLKDSAYWYKEVIAQNGANL